MPVTSVRDSESSSEGKGFGSSPMKPVSGWCRDQHALPCKRYGCSNNRLMEPWETWENQSEKDSSSVRAETKKQVQGLKPKGTFFQWWPHPCISTTWGDVRRPSHPYKACILICSIGKVLVNLNAIQQGLAVYVAKLECWMSTYRVYEEGWCCRGKVGKDGTNGVTSKKKVFSNMFMFQVCPLTSNDHLNNQVERLCMYVWIWYFYSADLDEQVTYLR